jgi:hypothetical protein
MRRRLRAWRTGLLAGVALLVFAVTAFWRWPRAEDNAAVSAPNAALDALAAADPAALLGTTVNLKLLSDAITQMDLERAQGLINEYQNAALSVVDAQRLGLERARLALYVGDCDSADAILGSMPGDDPQRMSLGSLAERCSRAVAASLVVEKPELGVWLRLQDARDEGLAPYIGRIAARARDAVEEDLGVRLPRPLRIDVVRDLFSLSSVSGLPVEAAETTGTVAVARWGRVTLLSPQAARHGYPWEDTLAHEIVHLALSRGTCDHAPLWLQEGVAKRGELRWRDARPFDDPELHDRIAKLALENGSSVGIDNLGPSIAMLPSAEAASIAFSEVTSFVSYWIEQNGRPAFHLLLADLKGLDDRDLDRALYSITGYSFKEWIERWQGHLRRLELAPLDEDQGYADASGQKLSRAARLGDLLFAARRFAAAEQQFARGQQAAPKLPAFRFRRARAELALRRPEEARAALGEMDEVLAPYGGWLALHARLVLDAQASAAAGAPAAPSAAAAGGALAGPGQQAQRDLDWALGLDPWSEIVACEGYDGDVLGSDPWQLQWPSDVDRRRLCELARARPSVR